MVKWADYLISHVRQNEGRITHVLLHVDNGETVSSGTVKTVREVILLINSGKTVKTIIWAYPKWNEGAVVTVVGDYLRTNRDNTAKDNLDNLIPLHS